MKSRSPARAQDRHRAVHGVALADAAEVDAHAGPVDGRRARSGIDVRPRGSRRAAVGRRSRRRVGTRLSWSWSNFQTSASAPKVTSNLPSVHSLTCRAASSTRRVSSCTITGAAPAPAFSRWTSLPSRQMLSSASSRSNSANTWSNAPRAADSSVVQAVRCSDEPIASRWSSTRARRDGGVTAAAAQRREPTSDDQPEGQRRPHLSGHILIGDVPPACGCALRPARGLASSRWRRRHRPGRASRASRSSAARWC